MISAVIPSVRIHFASTSVLAMLSFWTATFSLLCKLELFRFHFHITVYFQWDLNVMMRLRLKFWEAQSRKKNGDSFGEPTSRMLHLPGQDKGDREIIAHDCRWHDKAFEPYLLKQDIDRVFLCWDLLSFFSFPTITMTGFLKLMIWQPLCALTSWKPGFLYNMFRSEKSLLLISGTVYLCLAFTAIISAWMFLLFATETMSLKHFFFAGWKSTFVF